MLLASTCCAESIAAELGLTTEPKPATSYTAEVNSSVYSILMNNVRALDGVLMEGNAELITLFAQSMNQVPLQGAVPFNIIEP